MSHNVLVRPDPPLYLSVTISYALRGFVHIRQAVRKCCIVCLRLRVDSYRGSRDLPSHWHSLTAHSRTALCRAKSLPPSTLGMIATLEGHSSAKGVDSFYLFIHEICEL
jgi:hypothetical protein